MKKSNQNKLQFLTAIFSIFTLGQTLALTPQVSAETVKRVNGRCKLTTDDAKVFDGHCTFKHKQRDGVDVFAINLDNGQDFRFRGRSLNALQVEDYSGVHNVNFKSQDGSDRDVFRWNNNDGNNKLVVKLDNETPANADTNISSEDAVGTLIGIGIGALVSNLISGGNNSDSNNPKPSQPTMSQRPDNIADIAQAKGMPRFNATCPGKIEVHADKGGYVYINGKQASLKKFNNNYYEAKGSNTTISIAINPDESLNVSYTGPGRDHGICTVKDD